MQENSDVKDIIRALRNSIFVTLFYKILDQHKSERSWFDYVLLVLILTAILSLVSLWRKWFWKRYLNWSRRYFPKVGILNGTIKSRSGEHPCERRWSEMTPSMWYEKLKPEFQKPLLSEIHLIKTSEINHSWSLIINPFGENYPEENPKLLKTFREISEYINEGGIFVVTGSAFFYGQNTFATSQPERLLTHVIDGLQSLEHSLLVQEFGVKYTGNVHNPTTKEALLEEPIDATVFQTEEIQKKWGDLLQSITKLKRFRALTSETSDYLPIITQKDEDKWNEGKNIFLLAIVRYGKGALVHAGIHITSNNCDEFLVLKRFIKQLAKKKFVFN